MIGVGPITPRQAGRLRARRIGVGPRVYRRREENPRESGTGTDADTFRQLSCSGVMDAPRREHRTRQLASGVLMAFLSALRYCLIIAACSGRHIRWWNSWRDVWTAIHSLHYVRKMQWGQMKFAPGDLSNKSQIVFNTQIQRRVTHFHRHPQYRYTHEIVSTHLLRISNHRLVIISSLIRTNRKNQKS